MSRDKSGYSASNLLSNEGDYTPFLFFASCERGGIFETPMDSLYRSRKERASLRTALITHRDHIVVAFALLEKLKNTLGGV